jgi:uncharacterized membrane protein
MPPFILAFLLGIVAGMRAFVAPAAVAWAAYFGRLPVGGTHFAFMGHILTPILFTLAAIAEIAYEKSPRSAGNRRFPPKLIFRLLMGGFTGAVIGSSNQTNALFLCAAIGVIGAIAGTFGGTLVFEGLFKRLHDERKASLAEDAVAILLGFLVLIPIH